MKRDTLLIVDDSELDLAILNEIFKKLFQVKCLQNAQDAISFVHSQGERICAILLDICLGRAGTGFSLLKRLQCNEKTQKLPVILMTVDASAEYVMSSVEEGAVDFLVKPVNPHAVQERVCQIIKEAWPDAEPPEKTQAPKPKKEESDTLSLFQFLPEPLLPEQVEKLCKGWTDKLGPFFQHRAGVDPARSERLRRLTEVLARGCREHFPAHGLSEQNALYITHAAAFCDIGFLGVPDSVIQGGEAQPGPGRSQYFRHADLGRKLFEAMGGDHPFAAICAEVAYWHHKNYDGTGYPATDGAVTVPLSAQLVHLAMRCDTYIQSYRDHPDCFDRMLRALSSEAEYSISPDMYRIAQSVSEEIRKLLA